MNRIIFIIMFIIISTTFLFSQQKVLKIYYYERPPYYYTDSKGQVRGFLNDIVKKIFDNAQIKYRFESIPVKRILLTLEKGNYACSPGWFKTEERLKKFKYTLPIFKSKTQVVLVNKELKIGSKISIKEFSKLNLKLGLISGFNYGALLEKYFKKFCPKIERFTTSPDNLMKMVALHRIDYTFFSKENIEKFFKNYPQFAKKLKIVFIKEISEGIKRYIMCSKDVNDEIIRKIDNSIKELKNFK